MKTIKNSKHTVQFSLKSKVTAIAVSLVVVAALGCISNTNHISSTQNTSKHMQMFASVYKTQYGITTASSLSVRTGASTKYSSVGNMKKNTKVVMLGKTNKFYKITYSGKTRYISAQYVKITAKPLVVAVKPISYASNTGMNKMFNDSSVPLSEFYTATSKKFTNRTFNSGNKIYSMKVKQSGNNMLIFIDCQVSKKLSASFLNPPNGTVFIKYAENNAITPGRHVLRFKISKSIYNRCSDFTLQVSQNCFRGDRNLDKAYSWANFKK